MRRVTVFVQIMTIVFVVIFLLLSAVRFLLSPLFLEIEYRMPGFPADPYGFSMEERLVWSRVSIAYLVTNEDIDSLARQELSEGQPLYNERELSHMVDVKFLVHRAIITWNISIALLILFGLFSTEFKIASEFWDAFSKGGLWTIGLIVAILLGVILNFDYLFTTFHRVFFEGDTWLFRFSDSLIRLFPIRFWQDAFIMLGVLSSVAGIAVFFMGRLIRKKILLKEGDGS